MFIENEEKAYQLCLKAEAAIGARRYALALELTADAIAVEPQLENGYAVMGQTFFRLKKYEDAESIFKEGLKNCPGSELLLRGLAIAYGGQEKHERMLEVIERCLDLEPRNSHAFYHRGVALEKLNRIQQSTESFRKAIELEPDLAAFHARLGCHYLRIEKPKLAEAALQQAIQLGEQSADVFFNLGLAFWERKLLIEAASAFSTAIQIEPSLAEAKEHLVEVVDVHKNSAWILKSEFEYWLPWIPFVVAFAAEGENRWILFGLWAIVLSVILATKRIYRPIAHRQARQVLAERDPNIRRLYDQIKHYGDTESKPE